MTLSSNPIGLPLIEDLFFARISYLCLNSKAINDCCSLGAKFFTITWFDESIAAQYGTICTEMLQQLQSLHMSLLMYDDAIKIWLLYNARISRWAKILWVGTRIIVLNPHSLIDKEMLGWVSSFIKS